MESLMYEINISSYCYNFQKRLWWQMSSLMYQPEVKINYYLAVCKQDPNIEKTNKIIQVFSEYINIIPMWFDIEMMQTRGHTRNEVLKNTKGWILFTDSDMVFSPNYFETMFSKDINTYDLNKKTLFTSRRWYTLVEDGYKLANTVDFINPIKIDWNYLDKLCNISRKGRGSGNFQLLNRDLFDSLVYPSDDKKLSDGYLKCRSDVSFRRNINNTVEFKSTGKVYHIYHYIKRRDGIDVVRKYGDM